MSQPNLLIFMTDQQRGATVLRDECMTPNLDRMKDKGLTFENAFCPSPHCCPSRATFMTGLYPSMHGVWNNVGVTNALSRRLNSDVRCWSEDLADAGYDLVYSGKWHVSVEESPADRGWREEHVTAIEEGEYNWRKRVANAWKRYEENKDEWLNVQRDHRSEGDIVRPGWGPYRHYGRTEHPFGDVDVVDRAVQVIQSRAESGSAGPWCQFVGTLGPHDPYFVPERFLKMYENREVSLPESFEDSMTDRPGLYGRTQDVFSQLSGEEHRTALKYYYALATYEDYLFGRVVEALEEGGQLEDTIVIYTSDHGDYMGDHGLWCKGLPCFRGAYEIPLVVSWPGHLVNPGRREDSFVSLADIAPTILEAAGIEADRMFAGDSLMPFINEEDPGEWDDFHYTQTNGNEQYGIQRSVMTRRWKYVYNGFDYDELYDLESDPGETVNLAQQDEYREVKEELCAKMWEEGKKNLDNCINSYITVGFAPVGPAAGC